MSKPIEVLKAKIADAYSACLDYALTSPSGWAGELADLANRLSRAAKFVERDEAAIREDHAQRAREAGL